MYLLNSYYLPDTKKIDRASPGASLLVREIDNKYVSNKIFYDTNKHCEEEK